MNRRYLDLVLMEEEPATKLLALDAYAGAVGAVERAQRMRRYRRQTGILFSSQIEEIRQREYLISEIHLVPTGMYWRSHPEGRLTNFPETRSKGGGYYR